MGSRFYFFFFSSYPTVCLSAYRSRGGLSVSCVSPFLSSPFARSVFSISSSDRLLCRAHTSPLPQVVFLFTSAGTPNQVRKLSRFPGPSFAILFTRVCYYFSYVILKVPFSRSPLQCLWCVNLCGETRRVRVLFFVSMCLRRQHPVLSGPPVGPKCAPLEHPMATAFKCIVASKLKGLRGVAADHAVFVDVFAAALVLVVLK